MSERSLAALQQQRLIDMLGSLTLHLQHDLQLMQQQKYDLLTTSGMHQACMCQRLALAASAKPEAANRRPWR